MITLFLIFLVGVCNATMDVLFTRYDKSIFKKFNPSWWNPQESWTWKWSMPLREPTKKWYYFGFYPKYEERFPYSSTIFVWLTDAWHLFKSFMILFVVLGIVCYTPLISPLIDWLIYYVTWTFTFTILYDYLFIIKENK
jgi:hypothetical protein